MALGANVTTPSATSKIAFRQSRPRGDLLTTFGIDISRPVEVRESLDIFALRGNEVDQHDNPNAGECDQKPDEGRRRTDIACRCRRCAHARHRRKRRFRGHQTTGRQEQQDEQVPFVIHSVILPEQDLWAKWRPNGVKRPYCEEVRWNGPQGP